MPTPSILRNKFVFMDTSIKNNKKRKYMKKAPNMLASKLKPIIAELKTKYDWKKQRTEFEGCKFGTNRFTNSSTSSSSGIMMTRDDSNSDSIQD